MKSGRPRAVGLIRIVGDSLRWRVLLCATSVIAGLIGLSADAADAASRRPPRQRQIFLNELEWSSHSDFRETAERDISSGKTITIGGTPYAKGLGVHAPSDIRFALGGACSRFTSDIGVDDEVRQGSVLFEVWADGKRLFQSPLVRSGARARRISVNIRRRRELRLVVGDGGDGSTVDRADWADGRLLCSRAPPAARIAAPGAQRRRSAETLANAVDILVREVIRPEAMPSDAALVAYKLDKPFPAGTLVAPYLSAPGAKFATCSTAVPLSSAKWLFWIDDKPGARFGHPTRVVFVDPVSGAVEVRNESWGPCVNGRSVSQWTDERQSREHIAYRRSPKDSSRDRPAPAGAGEVRTLRMPLSDIISEMDAGMTEVQRRRPTSGPWKGFEERTYQAPGGGLKCVLAAGHDGVVSYELRASSAVFAGMNPQHKNMSVFVVFLLDLYGKASGVTKRARGEWVERRSPQMMRLVEVLSPWLSMPFNNANLPSMSYGYEDAHYRVHIEGSEAAFQVYPQSLSLAVELEAAKGKGKTAVIEAR